MRSAIILAAALGFLPLGALAQSEQKLVERYTDLAGSESNAKALVGGLRASSEFTLKNGSTTVTIDPPTQKMGFGNIDNALALTQAALEKQGIANATPEQLKVALTEVLGQRADGSGWGEIANSMGFRLGELKRAQNRPERTERVQHARAERPERVDRPDKPEKPERPMRPEKPERAQR
jgi:hypothetical protein